MNTPFLLLAQYGGAAVVPLDLVCRDYFQHLTPLKLSQKISAGEIALPMVRIDGTSQKSAKGVALMDLARWIDTRIEAGRKECAALTGTRWHNE